MLHRMVWHALLLHVRQQAWCGSRQRAGEVFAGPDLAMYALQEMEAAAVAWSADMFGTPMFCIKSVTDIVDGDRPAHVRPAWSNPGNLLHRCPALQFLAVPGNAPASTEGSLYDRNATTADSEPALPPCCLEVPAASRMPAWPDSFSASALLLSLPYNSSVRLDFQLL
jgi:hypothetical protein